MQEDKKGGFSLNFTSGSSKHRQKRVKVSEEEEKPQQQFVTGFSENGYTLRDGDKGYVDDEGKLRRVIPNLGNDMRGSGPRAYNPNRFLPEQEDPKKLENGADRFEVAAPEVRPEVKYGLTTFKAKDREEASAGNGVASAPEEGDGRGKPKKGRRVIGTGHDWESEAYQNDVDHLPDQASLEEYEAMPVEAFGEAMLRGMGWSEDNNTVEAQAKQFVRRAPLLGLGATAAPKAHKEKRFIKPGESREPKKEMVVYDAQGNLKHTRTADEKLVERVPKGPAVGKRMRILKGRHSGLLCSVQAIHAEASGHSQKADVRLIPSEEQVTVRLKDLGEKDEQPLAEKRQEPQQAKGSRDTSAVANYREEVSEPLERLDNSGAARPWLAPHIRVKVIDKKLGKGRLYLKKGEVTDVLTPTLCSISLDSGERVEASQSQLETVIPKTEGARLLLVSGKLRGKRARLLKRSTESSQAAVQLLEDFSVHKVSFDEISEFVGDMGEEE